MAIDLGCEPGPFALMMAASVDRSALSAEAALDLIGLVDRSIAVAHALRATLIAEYADRLEVDDPGTWEEQQDMDWHREQLAAVCQTSPHEADVRCRTAIALRDRLPATAVAVRSGSLPWAQAVVLARESDGLDDAGSSAVERAAVPTTTALLSSDASTLWSPSRLASSRQPSPPGLSRAARTRPRRRGR